MSDSIQCLRRQRYRRPARYSGRTREKARHEQLHARVGFLRSVPLELRSGAVQAEEGLLISRFAADKGKRELFAGLAAQIRGLIVEVETAINARIAGGKT